MGGDISKEIRSEQFRLFIALPVPESVKKEIQNAQGELRQALTPPSARWTRAEQWHLTLKFLGNLDAGKLDSLTDGVRAACAGIAPLNLRAEGIGCFPDLRRPRVIWAAVKDEMNQLVTLAKSVENAAADFTSEEREGKFIGHITIARINKISRPELHTLAKLVQSMARRTFGEWAAGMVEIMCSELTAGGARHSCLVRLPLNGSVKD